jgi:hypothetical protein
MVVVRFSDGIGNQMFQYACGRALALARDQPLALDPCGYAAGAARPYLMDYFHTAGSTLKVVGRRKGSQVVYGSRVPPGIREFREKRLGFKPELAGLPDEHILLCGYFQSEKYFQGITGHIRAELRFRSLPSDDTVHQVESQIAAGNSVSVHLRRTDYVDRARFDVLGTRYFERAIARCRELVPDPRFFVFSDDLEYCRAQPALAGAVFVASDAARRNALVDMRLMSLCRHHIIANSSFSWWGAWLDARPGKVVIAPSLWFQSPDDPPIDDVLPPEWMRVDP